MRAALSVVVALGAFAAGVPGWAALLLAAAVASGGGRSS